MSQYKKIRRCDTDCHLFEFDPKVTRFDITVGKPGVLERLSSMDGEPKDYEYTICKMNGGYFSMDGATEYIGSFVDEGKWVRGSWPNFPTVYFTKNYELKYDMNPNHDRHRWYAENTQWAIGVPWKLVDNGVKDFGFTKNEMIKLFTHPYQRAPRTFFGQKKDGNIVWVVADGRTNVNKGLTTDHMANIMIELGCRIAFNLDGGGSSEMMYKNAIVNKPSDKAERRIGTALVAYEKKTSKDVTMERKGINLAKDGLNVRNKPGTHGVVVGVFKYKQNVEIIGVDSNTGWYKVRFPNVTEAYVSNNYIKLV